MNNREWLPNVFIIGAAKSGTTSVADVLSEHSDIFLAIDKEPSFFATDHFFKKGLSFYKQFFKKSEKFKFRIDASPQYLYHYEKVPKRLMGFYRDESIDTTLLKFICVLRNPVDRAYSSFWQAKRIGFVNGTFENALKEEKDFIKTEKYKAEGRTAMAFIDAGLYADQLDGWMKYISKEQLFILTNDELKNNPEKCYLKILKFLGAKPYTLDYKKSSNEAKTPKSKIINNLKIQDSITKKIFVKLVPILIRNKIKRILDRYNLKEIKYEPINSETRIDLLESFRKSNIKLENEYYISEAASWSKAE